MTENNNQTMSLEDITRALTELAKHVEAIRGDESAPALDPNDPLNVVLPTTHVAYDASGGDDAKMNRILASSGEPRTIRNVLWAYMQVSSPDDWYTLRSGDNRYRISLARHHRVTSPAGVTQTVVSTNDFGIHLPGSERLTAGWVVEGTPVGTAKVLDVYEHADKQYLIYEMPDC
jgi:hypothetical protein